MGFVKSIVSRTTHNVIYGNGKVPTCIKSVTSLITAHAATSGETIHRGASKTEFSDVGSIHDSHSR